MVTTALPSPTAAPAPPAGAPRYAPRDPADWPAYFRGALRSTREHIFSRLIQEPMWELRDAIEAAQDEGAADVVRELTTLHEELTWELLLSAHGFGPINPEEFEVDGESATPSPERLAQHHRDMVAHSWRIASEGLRVLQDSVCDLRRRIRRAVDENDPAMAEALRAVLGDVHRRIPELAVMVLGGDLEPATPTVIAPRPAAAAALHLVSVSGVAA